MSSTAVSTDALLTDDMLARFDERAPVYDRENRFFDEDFEELKASGLPAGRRARRARRQRASASTSTRSSCAGSPTRRRPPPWPSTCTATGPAWPPTCCSAGDDSCRWILEKAAEGEVFAALHGEAGNDLPLLLSTTSARAGRRRLGDLRPQDLRQPHARCGPTAASTPWTPPTRPRPKIVHGFLPRDTPPATRSSTPGTRSACGPPRARTPCSTRRSCPTSSCPLVCPAGLRRRRPVPRGHLRLGAAGLRRGLPRRGQAGLRPHASRRMPAATSIALTSSMAHHPEVQHNVAEMRIALDAAEALLDARPHRLGRRRRARATGRSGWSATRYVRDQPGLRRSSTAPSTSPAAPAPSSATASSSSSATCGWAASTRATRCSPTS